MQRFLSLLLSIIFVLSGVPMLTLASYADDNGVLTNVTKSENAMPYATSEKTTLWTPSKALIDGAYSKDTWQGWECGYPDIIYGSDTSKGFSGEYFGVKFTNKEYYELYEIYINLGMHAAMGGQNAHYLVQCLVEGVWITVAEFSDSDATPIETKKDGTPKFSSYEDAMKNDTSFYHIPAEYKIKLDTPITTNNVRVTLSEYGKNYPGGDVLIFPYVYEIELIGKRGQTPAIELPEGAVISTNIGYRSYPAASSSTSSGYPYRAIDGKVNTAWSPKGKESGEYFQLNFTEPKKINKLVLNFGEYLDGVTYVDYKFQIDALIGNQWQKLSDGTSLDDEKKSLITEYCFEEIETQSIRLTFTEGYSKSPKLYEFEAHLSSEKTYYVEDRYNSFHIGSASKGNIAVIGTPYANTDFAPYSDVNYIVDGRTDNDANVWFTGVVDMPSYCGVKFYEKQLIDRVALYFYTPDEEGIDIMDIQVQALIDGEYVTIVDTKSYHKELKYSPAYKIEPVETTDIRVLYTRGNGTFANLRELELYSPNGNVEMFKGLTPMYKAPTFIDYPEASEPSSPDSEGDVVIPPCDRPTTEPSQTPDDGQCNEKNDDSSVLVVALIIIGSVLALAVCAIVIIVVVKTRKNRKSAQL